MRHRQCFSGIGLVSANSSGIHHASRVSHLARAVARSSLEGHRIDDDRYALLTRPVTPRQMLDPSDFYSYDSLAVS